MNTLGIPSDAEIVFPAPHSGALPSERNPLEPTNEELLLAETDGIDPWLLEGENAVSALNGCYVYGDSEQFKLLDVLSSIEIIGHLAILTTDDGIKVSDVLSDNEALLLDKVSRPMHFPESQSAEWPDFSISQSLTPSIQRLTIGQRWKATVASLMASTSIAPALLAMPQMAQFGLYGLAVGGVGLGVPVAKSAWDMMKANQQETERVQQEKEALVLHGEDLVKAINQSMEKLKNRPAVFIPDVDSKIDLKSVRRQLDKSEVRYTKIIDQQISSITPLTEAEELQMAEETWGPAIDLMDRAYDYGIGSIGKDDLGNALQALQKGRKDRKNHGHTLIFNPAEAVREMLRGIHAARPEYLTRAWNGAKNPGIKQYSQAIATLQYELDQADEKTVRIKTINDGLQNDLQSDKLVEKRYKAMRSAKERALHMAEIKLIAFSEAVTHHLLSVVFDERNTQKTPVWQQPNQG